MDLDYATTGTTTTTSTGISNGYVYVDGGLTVIEKIKGGKDMMGLYEVYVVETKKQLFAVDQIIAKEARIAERKTNIPDDYNLDDCVFFTKLIGEWESKKPKEVKIVKE